MSYPPTTDPMARLRAYRPPDPMARLRAYEPTSGPTRGVLDSYLGLREDDDEEERPAAPAMEALRAYVAGREPEIQEPEEDRGIVDAIGASLVRGAGRTVESLGGVLRAGAENPESFVATAREIAGEEPIDPEKDLVARAGRAVTEKGRDLAEAYPESPSIQGKVELTNPRWWLENVPGEAMHMAAQLGLIYATRGRGAGAQVAALTPTAVREGGSTYNEVLERTGDAAAASRAMVSTAAGSMLLERIGADVILAKVPGARGVFDVEFAKRLPGVVAGAGAEGATEAAQEAWAATADYIQTRDPEAYAGLPDRLKAGAALGAVLGGAAGGVTSAAARGGRDLEHDRAIDELARARMDPAYAQERAVEAETQADATPAGPEPVATESGPDPMQRLRDYVEPEGDASEGPEVANPLAAEPANESAPGPTSRLPRRPHEPRVTVVEGTEFANPETTDFTTLRAKATAYARDRYQGLRVPNLATGKKIKIGKKGIGAAGSHAANPDDLLALAGLPGLLREAVPVSTEPNRKESEAKHLPWVHVFEAPIRIGGRDRVERLVVKEGRQGRFFYMGRVEPPNPASGSDGISGAPTNAPPGPTGSMESVRGPDAENKPTAGLEAEVDPSGPSRREGGFLDLGTRSAAIPPDAPVRSTIDEVEERWRAAKGIQRPGLRERVLEGTKRLKQSLRQHFPELDTKASQKDAATADVLRQWEASPEWAETVAIDALTEQIEDLDNEQIDLVARNLALPDLIRSVDEGLYTGKDLPFGYPSRAAMEADLAQFEAAAAADPKVAAAIEKRQAYVEKLTGRLVDLGLLSPKALENVGAYYHRQVLEYMNAERGTGRPKDVRANRRGFQRARTGGGDFNTAYQEAEFEWVYQALQLIATKEALGRVQRLNDAKADLEAEAELLSEERGEEVSWRELVPDDHVIWQPERGNRFFRALTIPEETLDRILEERGEIVPEDLREGLVVGGPKEEWVVPANVAATLDDVGGVAKDEGPIPRLQKAAVASWKQWILLNPLRVLKYNLNNTSGDLDIAVAYDPRIAKYIGKATRDLYLQNKRTLRQETHDELLDGIQRGVLNSGFAIADVPDINDLGVWRALTSDDPNVFQRISKRYWGGVRNATNMRENVLRLAAWRYFRDQIAAGKNPYGASKAYEIDALSDPDDRAAKLSRELIGDYGNISHAGQYIRSQFIPFWSWMEINAPRYVRLMANLPHEGRGGRGRVAAAAAAKTAGKAAGLAVKANLLFLLVNMWNHLKFPEEEKELRRGGREPHIILGRTEDGEAIRTLRFEGALSDALEWLDLHDLPADVADVREGKRDLADKAAEAVKSPLERGVQAYEPFSKSLFEMTMGRSAWPTLFEEGSSFKTRTSPIRDRGEYATRLFSLNKLYNIVTKKPQPPGANNPVDALLFYRTDPGEAAYWSAKQLTFDYSRDVLDKESPDIGITEKGNALYYHKRALRWGDAEAARHWLTRYRELGGTDRGLTQSVARSAPLGALAQKDRPGFLESLDPEEREMVELAERWYRGVYGDASSSSSRGRRRRRRRRRR